MKKGEQKTEKKKQEEEAKRVRTLSSLHLNKTSPYQTSKGGGRVGFGGARKAFEFSQMHKELEQMDPTQALMI